MKLHSSSISCTGMIVCPVILATKNQLTEQNLVEITNLVNKIARYKLPGHHRQIIEDVAQTVTLNLWRWQQKKIVKTAGFRTNEIMPDMSRLILSADDMPRSEKRYFTVASPNHERITRTEKKSSKQVKVAKPETEKTEPIVEDNSALTAEALLKIAARASLNEINSYFAHKQHREVAFCQPTDGGALPQVFADYGSSRIEGETKTEASSLLKFVWSQMPALSLRERYCFLLNRDELIDDLVGHGICKLAEIAEYLELSRADFILILEKLPVKDELLKELIEQRTGAAITLKQIWTTRSKARRKLADKLALSP